MTRSKDSLRTNGPTPLNSFAKAPPTQSADGAALLELALTLPVILLLVAGITSWWNVISKQDLILTASRHGARTAAAVARTSELNGDVSSACTDDGGTSAALSAGVALAYRYLVASGLETGTCTPTGSPKRSCAGGTYSVSAAYETICEGGFGQKAIRVEVKSNAAIPCAFCFERLFEGISIRGQAIFVPEANCSSLGAIVCP